MDGWMDGEDLIICVAIWTLYKRRRPLVSADLRASCIASRNKLRFASLCGAILEVLGGQNGSPDRIFELFFPMLFSIAFLHRFSIYFLRLRTSKIAIFLRKNNDFCKIGVFYKGMANLGFGVHFRRPKRINFDEKSSPKTSCFSTSIFMRFIWILAPFWPPKILQKSLIFENIEVRRRPLNHYVFRIAFWTDFEALRARLRLIFGPPEIIFVAPASNLEKHAWSISGCRTCFDD